MYAIYFKSPFPPQAIKLALEVAKLAVDAVKQVRPSRIGAMDPHVSFRNRAYAKLRPGQVSLKLPPGPAFPVSQGLPALLQNITASN